MVVTRKNQRLPHHPTRQGGLAPRNRDRWHLAAINSDGTVVVSRVDRRSTTVTLPAEYAAQHLQLGYADTGHGVQGRTGSRPRSWSAPATPAGTCTWP